MVTIGVVWSTGTRRVNCKSAIEAFSRQNLQQQRSRWLRRHRAGDAVTNLSAVPILYSSGRLGKWCTNYTAYKVDVIHIGSPLDSQIQLLSGVRVSQYFTSLALGKTGWVSVGTDRDASWQTDCQADPIVCVPLHLRASFTYLVVVPIEKQHHWLCIRVKRGGGGWKRNFLSNPCSAWIGHGQASEGVQLSNEPSVKGDLYTSWNDACSAPHPTLPYSRWELLPVTATTPYKTDQLTDDFSFFSYRFHTYCRNHRHLLIQLAQSWMCILDNIVSVTIADTRLKWNVVYVLEIWGFKSFVMLRRADW